MKAVLLVTLLVVSVFADAEKSDTKPDDKKHAKRGVFGWGGLGGYYSTGGFGHGYGYDHSSYIASAPHYIQPHSHTHSVETKVVPQPYPVVQKIPYPVPQPYPVVKIIEKKIAVPQPYPVEVVRPVPQPYPVVKTQVVEKHIPIDRPYPVPVHVKVPVVHTKVVEKPVAVPVASAAFVHHHAGHIVAATPAPYIASVSVAPAAYNEGYYAGPANIPHVEHYHH